MTFKNLFAKKFFSLLFIFTALIILSATKIEGMIHKPERTEGPAQSINPLLKPLQDLCNKCIDIESIQKAFNETFVLICAMVAQQNNPSQNILCLEGLAYGEELNQLVEQLIKPISHDVGIVIQKVFENEKKQLLEKISTLLLMLDEVITARQKPEYLNNTLLLQKEVISRLQQEDGKLNHWGTALGSITNSCILL